jgi:hypothetical protein
MLQCGRSLISGNIALNISRAILSFLLIRVLLFFKLVPVSCIDPPPGYPSSPYVLRPFTEPEVNGQLAAEKARRRKFNKRLSSQRIIVEHTFGMLKGRFPSLKDLPPEQDIRDTYRVVEALFTLHNMCIDLGDTPESIPLFDSSDPDADENFGDDVADVDVSGYGGVVGDDEPEVPLWESDEWLREAGRRRRIMILNDLFPL